MARTTYTVAGGRYGTTDSAEVAEVWSRAGVPVTAVTEPDA
ncbi:hypothetical protein [Halobaculum magnesiiphilum]|nr:hypothetical protein [Halobaculum magnesiiphilum]